MEFTIKFYGVTLGALGDQQTFTVNVNAENLESAILKLYDNYEHITVLEVNGIKFSYSI